MNVPVRADPLPSWEEYQNRCTLGFASVVPTPWARDVAELYGHNTPVLYHIRIASSCVVRFQSIMCCVEYLVIHSLPLPPVSPSIEFVNSSSR